MTTAYDMGQVPPIEVRHRLRIAREYAQLEQDQLAEIIGVSRTTVSNAEKGRVKPRPITVNAWALACGVPRSWLLDGTAPTSHPPKGVSRNRDADLLNSDGQSKPKPTDEEFGSQRPAQAA